MITNQPNKRLFSGAAGTLALTERRAAIMLLMMLFMTVTAWATDVTLSESDNYTAQDGDVLTGSTSGTVTIANNAKITLSGVTITGSIVCNGTAEITLVGTNSVSNTWYSSAGIQIGGSGTTLTIKGNGSLNATGGSAAAGIGLGRTWDANAMGGSVVIEGGTVTASGGNGIGTGTVGNSMTAHMDGIIIKGGTVNARLGKGTINYGSSVTIGTIKIYDGIEKVDASAITESVTYMHVDGNTETDVTASASTYFTITEDGDRRVIVPKDNTDYNITIADGIEHGTLTGAATAKYMEKVTITATPDFGYRLSRLVVKDAQNNNVESTGNSFFMPKSNVTVSAVFEQGTHGTTEFKWLYQTGPEPENIVLETIYDGVTTVNIQNREMSYNIRKYEGNTYYIFLLDNNTYDANIPYAGGTGEFYKLGNPTNFVFPYDGETGYYDITMTDVGNGKWSVSILKTVGVIDNIPDQTYSGSAITPEPLVLAGSLSLTKGTDYVYSYTNNTNVGTAKVRATFQGNYASLGYVEKEFTILPSTVIVNVTGNGTVTYNDKSAASGETFGVAAEKGTDVTLTLTPENGYAVRSVAYGYTNNSGMTASGFKLPINGTTATLTVPNDLKDGTYVNLTVSFVSALAGGADEASAVALTDATVTDLRGGWYKVENDITFDHTLNLLADTYLTIAEGKTMTVNTASGKAIDSEYTLNVSGAGALNITTAEAYKIAVRVGSYVQTGATVTANGYIGIRCMDNFDEFNVTNDFTFSGGQLTATGNSGGIWADNDITLSCTNATDFIQASSYSSGYGAVKIAEGKMLVDATDGSKYYIGDGNALSSSAISAIAGKTLKPGLLLIDNADNSAQINALGGLQTTAILQGRKLWKDGAWNTLCLPFSVTIAGSVLDGTGVVARTLTEASIEGTTLNLTFGDAVTTLTAGVPYIIKWTKDDEHPTIDDPVFSGVTIDATDNSFDNQVSGDERVRFLGTYKSTTFTDEDKSILFLGAENALYYPQPDIDTENPANSKYPTIGAQRAYFKIGEDDAPQQARRLTAFNIDFGDEQTGIVSVSKDSGSEGMAGAWFSLDGVRIDGKPTRKGLYIHNGRKEVVK